MSPPDIFLLQTAPSSGSPFGSSAILLVAFVAIFYFVLIRPQQKEAQETQKLIASLQKGDRVVTSSGIHAKVHEAKGDTLVVELAPNSFMTIDRDAVKRKVTDPPAAAPAKGA